MKHLLRKLHIGGAINEPHRLPTAPIPNLPSSSNTGRPNEAAADRTDTEERGGDFNLLEEEFQMQLALAISASDPDVRKDPESAQIDAAKQMSLGCETSVSDTVQFQSLRYWV